MAYKSLEECLLDLEKNGHLFRVREEVDPYLEMAAIHLRVHEKHGPALLFENVKGCKYRAASNIFGTLERSRFIFRDTFEKVQELIRIKNDPVSVLKHPFKYAGIAISAFNALPLRHTPSFEEIRLQDIPHIHHWKNDGGAFITLPQVFTGDIDMPGIMKANLGMYRVQLSGNTYEAGKEVGLHYQLHRGIGVHQTKAAGKGVPLKVSVFVGGPPAHTVAAVMPLPEGISELTFAGALAGRRFRYHYQDGYCLSTDADFVITGEVITGYNKPEGPFGDHLGYYSLEHHFPVLKVQKVFARKNAIWPFTVVGRPPQEDTSFGQLIHDLAGDAIQSEIPGLKEIHAVDAAGVHPLLLAIGHERYTPYLTEKKPAEILTIANHILGTGQLSLAKFLFITADDTNSLSTHHIESFLQFILKRIDMERDIHFLTNTTIDTLDYSGSAINSGSKVVFATYGDAIRKLGTEIPGCFVNLQEFSEARLVMPGIIAIKAERFTDYENAQRQMELLDQQLIPYISKLENYPIIIVTDDTGFLTGHLNNFLWVTFTRCNPSHDIYGIAASTIYKHWGCKGPLVIDSRVKPHHAPVLEKDPNVEEAIDRIFSKGGSLYKFC